VARTQIDIDEAACRAVMDRYGLRTEEQAGNLALRLVAAEAEDPRDLRGSGWEGDLEALRQGRGG
jgi:Arc/MetJ family transcription regulator